MVQQAQQSKIDYWSPSSFNAFLTNRSAFKDTYILKIYDNTMSPSSVVGSAAHKALEAYYNGADHAKAKEEGLKYIAKLSDYGINYGKTGSRAKILSVYNQALDFYFKEEPEYHAIEGIELNLVSEVQTVYGDPLPLPMKGKLDLLTRNKLGQLEIIDHKFVGSYTDGTVTNPHRFMQAMFYFHLVWAVYGEKPVRMIFNECKTSKNTNGENQIQPYTIDFQEMSSYFPAFYKLYDLTTQELDRAEIFLPNFNDTFNGQAAFDKFVAGAIDLEAPVAVKHKTEQLTYQDKKFVPSTFDKVENKHLTPEERIRAKLMEFGAPVEHNETKIGPSVTKYFFTPAAGISMKKVASLENDLKLAVKAESLRIEAPVPGTGMIGIEVPSEVRSRIDFGEQYLKDGTMTIPIGMNINGDMVHKDLTKMPHLLIAGTTGSGKSVMINVLIESLIRQMKPDDMKLLLIDPKQVELAFFEDDEHLLRDIITDSTEAMHALDDMVKEMELRYKTLRDHRCRTIEDYHAKGHKMPYIVIVIDEFADLMMTSEKLNPNNFDLKKFTYALHDAIEQSPRGLTQKAVKHAIDLIVANGPKDVETSIVRIAQKARAVGIHLVVATQRPSVDVVTGLIKANIPTKIAFMVSSRINSQVILDQPGAEELIGQGDMLFQDPSKNTLQRLQGLYV